ncbi:MAG: hypothetical protein V4721_10510 [Bacteroidota bacterium]
MEPYRREGEDKYDEEYYSRESYRIKRDDDDFLGDDTYIDILRAVNSDHPTLKTCFTGDTNCVLFDEIMKFKVNHALSGEHHTRYKHKDDLIFMLVANK